MNSDVLCSNEEALVSTESAYADNGVTYSAFILGACRPSHVVHDEGNLFEMVYTSIDYEVAQKHPQQLTAALKLSMTELPQIHAFPTIFKYCKYPSGCEIIIAKQQSGAMPNVNAGIIQELMKEYDCVGYNGNGSNHGISNNPKGVYYKSKLDLSSDDAYKEFKKEVDKIINGLRDATDITSNNYSEVQFCYTRKIEALLGETDLYGTSNRDKLKTAYPSVVFVEIPSVIEKRDAMYVSYVPDLVLHRGAIPSIDAQEAKFYGKSLGTLYAYESTGIQLRKKGSIQFTVFE